MPRRGGGKADDASEGVSWMPAAAYRMRDVRREISLEEARRIVEKHGLALPEAAYRGLLARRWLATSPMENGRRDGGPWDVRYNGEGTREYRCAAAVYEGEFKANKREGSGYRDAYGNVYEGQCGGGARIVMSMATCMMDNGRAAWKRARGT